MSKRAIKITLTILWCAWLELVMWLAFTNPQIGSFLALQEVLGFIVSTVLLAYVTIKVLMS